MKLVLLCIRKKIYSLPIIVTNSRRCLWVLNGVYVVIMVLSSRVSGHLIGSSGDVWKVSVGSFGVAAFTAFSDEEYNFCRVGKIKWKVQKRLISNSTAGKSELGREKVLTA